MALGEAETLYHLTPPAPPEEPVVEDPVVEDPVE
jgi:hypothetical protein